MNQLPLEIIEKIALNLSVTNCARFSQALSSSEHLNPLFSNESFCLRLLDRDYYNHSSYNHELWDVSSFPEKGLDEQIPTSRSIIESANLRPLQLLQLLYLFEERLYLEASFKVGLRTMDICRHTFLGFGALNVCTLSFDNDDMHVVVEDDRMPLFEVNGTQLIPYTSNMDEYNIWTLKHANSTMRVSITRHLMLAGFNDLPVEEDFEENVPPFSIDTANILIDIGFCRWVRSKIPTQEPFGEFKCIYPTGSIDALAKRVNDRIEADISERYRMASSIKEKRYIMRYVTGLGNVYLNNKKFVKECLEDKFADSEFTIDEIKSVLPDFREGQLCMNNPRSLFPFSLYGDFTPCDVNVHVIEIKVHYRHDWVNMSFECISPICHHSTNQPFSLCKVHETSRHMIRDSDYNRWKDESVFEARRNYLQFLEEREFDDSDDEDIGPNMIAIQIRKNVINNPLVFVLTDSWLERSD